MLEERSAGVLVYREFERREYLLLHYPAGHWDYPKGHVEEGEGPRETAVRELKEETGISPDNVELEEDFVEVIDYTYHKKNEFSHKEVTYFLGKSNVKDIKISREHQDYIWLPYERALKRLTFWNAKKVMKSAEKFLGGRNPGEGDDPLAGP